MEILLGGIVFLFVGGVFVVVGIYLRKDSLMMRVNGIKAKAKIIDFDRKNFEDMDGNTKEYYLPIVRFYNKKGEVLQGKLDTSMRPKRINQDVNIIYLMKEGDLCVMIDSVWRTIYLPVFVMIFGVLLSLIGVFILINSNW